MEKQLSVTFNHYRGEGGSAEEISRDFDVKAEKETIQIGRRKTEYLTLVGSRENVMDFLEEYALDFIVDGEPNEEDENTEFYYETEEEEED